MPMTHKSISRFPRPTILTVFLALSPVLLHCRLLLQNGLALNPSKMEVILLVTRQRLALFNSVYSNHRDRLFCFTAHPSKLLASFHRFKLVFRESHSLVQSVYNRQYPGSLTACYTRFLNIILPHFTASTMLSCASRLDRSTVVRLFRET